MIDDVTPALTVIATVGCGLIGGLLFAFSVAVMPALARRPAAEGMAAMQAVNRVILNPVFLLIFVGTTAICAFLAVTAPFAEVGGAGWRGAGALAYLVGAFVVTGAANVPLNDRLEAADAHSEEGERLWRHYLRRWTAWNHLRVVASVVATAALATGQAA
ncbi:MAG: DUF1772 domain-containing protein [Acidimicrobiales bacterium]|nr:DUF1772 domain-containing protein [Acidimicrobiales bacterium]